MLMISGGMVKKPSQKKRPSAERRLVESKNSPGLSAPRPVASDRRATIDIGIAESVSDPRLVEVVRAHLHLDEIAGRNLDEVLPQFSRDMGKNGVTVSQFHSKHGPRQDRYNFAFNLNGVIICHKKRKNSSSISKLLNGLSRKKSKRKAQKFTKQPLSAKCVKTA
jgi:hypothetical protein